MYVFFRLLLFQLYELYFSKKFITDCNKLLDIQPFKLSLNIGLYIYIYLVFGEAYSKSSFFSNLRYFLENQETPF